jgi:hypothetical protein
MTVLALPTRYFPPLKTTQTSATGEAAQLVAKLLANVVQHERERASDWRPFVRGIIEQVALECSTLSWDGYGAAPVSPTAVEYARRFVEELPADLEQPQVVPDPDGDISLYWEFGTDRVFTISIGASGVVSYAGILAPGVQRHGEEPFREDVPEILIESIREVASPRSSPY